jgi:hypothetical protein
MSKAESWPVSEDRSQSSSSES